MWLGNSSVPFLGYGRARFQFNGRAHRGSSHAQWHDEYTTRALRAISRGPEYGDCVPRVFVQQPAGQMALPATPLQMHACKADWFLKSLSSPEIHGASPLQGVQ